MASLPASPWTDIEDFRVAVDAPLSTDLMQDIVVDLNYLKSGVDSLAGSNMAVYLATGTFTVPAGITKIKMRGWGGGGGGGGGADLAGNGNVGGAGGDSWVGVSSNKARGGNGGGGGIVGGASGAQAAELLPVFSATSIQFGSETAGAVPATGTAGNLFRSPRMIPGGFGVSASQQGGIAGTQGGGAGLSNTGQGGGGGAYNGVPGPGFGSPGAPGEYAEWIITVVPGDVLTVTIGAAGAAGAAGGGGAFAGGAGGTGIVAIVY